MASPFEDVELSDDLILGLIDARRRQKAIELEASGEDPASAMPLAAAMSDAGVDEARRSGSVYRDAPQGGKKHSTSRHLIRTTPDGQAFSGDGIPASQAVDIGPRVPSWSKDKRLWVGKQYNPSVRGQVDDFGAAVGERIGKGSSPVDPWGGSWSAKNRDEPHAEFRPGQSELRVPSAEYTQSLIDKERSLLGSPALQRETASAKLADAAVTAALSEKSSKLAQESTKPSEPNDGSGIMPRPQLAGVLQSLADMGYEDDVVEYLTTSQDPSQPIKQRNIAEEMGSAYKTDPMNDGSVKYGVYIPGSGLGGAVRSGPRMAYDGMRISSKPYAEQAYKNEALVRVSETPGAGEPAWNAQLLHDAVKGLNKKHAEATARANWPGRKVEVIDFGPKGRFDKLLEEVAPLEEMLEKIWRNKK